MKTGPSGPRSPLLPVLLSWTIFLAFSSRVWPSLGIAIGEESGGAAATQWLRSFPWNIPLMSQVYHGPWVIYSLAPFVGLGGATLASLRCYTACLFLLALWGTYLLARALCRSDAAAFLATLLLAGCPTMATFCGLNTFPVPGIALSAWTLYFGLSFARTRRPGFTWRGAGAFFAGLCCHSCFAALGVGLLLCFVLAPRRWLALLPETRRKRAELLAGCLACGGFFLLPMLVFNIASGGRTVRFLLQHLTERASFGCSWSVSCSNLDYWTNLKERFLELALLCDGDYVAAKMPWHLAYGAGLSFSLAFTAREAWRRRTLWLAPVMLWIAAIGFLLVSPISPTSEVLAHMVPLAPVGAVLLFAWLGLVPPGRLRGAALAAGALLAAAQFAGDLVFLGPDRVGPADAAWYAQSPLMVEVCDWAADRPQTPVVPLSLALSFALRYFGEGRATILDQHGPFDAPATFTWNQWLRRGDKPYFLVENDSMGSALFAALKSEASRIGAPLVLVKVFADRFGRSEFEVYRVR